MTKHIVGFIIFTLIVGTSVVIAGLFSYSATPKTISLKGHQHDYKVYKKKKKKKRCRKRRKERNVEATVSQAVFDKNAGQLTTKINFSSDLFDSDVDLHFFVKDEFGTQYLKKETISATYASGVYENSFAWLNRLESKENLYVIPKVRNSRHSWDYQPSFIASKATPVQLAE